MGDKTRGLGFVRLVGDKTRQAKTREQEQQRRLTVVGAAVGALMIGAAVSPWSVVRWAQGVRGGFGVKTR